MSPAMLSTETPLRACGSGVQLRGGRGNSKRDATCPATTAAAGAPHASNGTSTAFPQPACQPMPVHVLVHLLEHLSSHRPPAKDSRAILHALHDYIGDAICQPGGSPSSQCSTDFDTIPPSSSPLPWASAAQPVPTAPTHEAPVNGAPANGAAASLPAKSSAGGFAAARAAEGANGSAGPMSAQSPIAASSTLQEHIMRWSADLGILQAMYSAGFSEGEVEAFVTKLLPGLAEGVKSQLSQAGAQLGGLTGTASTPSAPAASAGDLETPLSQFGSSFPLSARSMPQILSDRSVPKAADDDDAAPADAAAADGVPSAAAAAVPPLPPLPQGVAVVTDRVSPFIQRPYHLLQQLHEHAKSRSGGASGSISGVSSGSASGRAPSDIESSSSFSKPCPMPLKHGASPTSPPDSPAASKPTSTSASPISTPQEPTDTSEDSGNIFSAERKVGTHSDDSAGESAAQLSPASAVASKTATGDAGSGSEGAQQAASAGWKSVLDMLISAGPQAVQPAASYVPSYAWGSGNSSTEPDTFSAKSEEPAAGGGSGDGAAPPAAAAAGTSKAKKRRNKRSKNGSRNGA